MVRSRPIIASVVDPPDPGSPAPDAGLGLLDRVEDLDRTRLHQVYLRKLLGRPEPEGTLGVDIRSWGLGQDESLLLDFVATDAVRVSFDRFFGGQSEVVQFRPGEPCRYHEAELVLHPQGDLTGRSFRVIRRRRQKTIDHFLNDLAVRETQRGSSVLSIAYPDADPHRSAAIVNALVRSYLAHNRQRQVNQAGRSVEFLEAELTRVREELRQSEQRLQEFGQQAGDIVLPETAVSLIQELVAVDVEKAKLDLGSRSKLDLLGRIREGQFTELSVAAVEASAFEEFKPEVPLSSLIAQRSALLAEYTEEWPEVRQLTAEIDDRVRAIESLLEQEIEQDAGLADDLEQISARYASKLGELPEAQIELLRHQRSVETFSKIFTLLVGQIQEAKITEASAVPTGEVIEWATAPRLRKAPRLKLNVALGGLLGLMLGLGASLLRELRRPLTTSLQAEDAFGARILHAIPRARARNALVVLDQPGSAGAESYRALRSAFGHAVEESGRRAVVLCGVQAGDGASTTAANLAITLARAGRRILLVDAVAEDDRLEQWFGLAVEQGLAQVIAGEASWAEVVVSSAQDGLDFLPLGKSEHAADLVASSRATDWLPQALERYDLVLFDAPAMLERSEAGALASAVGALVFVCRAEGTPEPLAIEAAARARRAGAQVLGVVLNAVRRAGSGVV